MVKHADGDKISCCLQLGY